jgi:acyl-CoA synthetase (AMP-forming)/AMP-acid ligase II
LRLAFQQNRASLVRVDTLLSLLDSQAGQFGARPAVIDANRNTITYTDLVTRVRGIATRLTDLGVHRSDRVAIVLPNGPDAAVGFLGVAAAAAAAPLNPAYSRDEFAFYFGDLQTKLAIVDAAAAPAAIEAASSLSVRVIALPSLVGPDLASGPQDSETARTQGPALHGPLRPGQ